MHPNDTCVLCRCGCGEPAYPDSGFARGSRPCRGTDEQRFLARIDQSDTCWLWTGILKEADSYGRLWTSRGLVRAHRFAWEMASGIPIPDGLDALHVCDIRHCVRNDDIGTYEVEGVLYERRGHLWLGNHAANMADKAQKGRAGRLERPPGRGQGWNAKLTEEQVHEIRYLLEIGWTHRALAQKFGVSKGPITGIARGVLWKHI